MRFAVARLALICGALLFSPALAAAQSDDDLAKQYYKLGEELYNRADYEGALKQFRQAFDLSRKPALLYNMARCQESLGEHQKAIELLTQYLTSNPENRTMIEARITNLRRLVQKQQERQPKLPVATAPTPPVNRTEPTPPPPPPPPPSRPLRTPGWVGVGVGGALLITGVVLGVVAKSKANDLETANRIHQEYSAVKGLEDSQRTYRNAAIGTIVTGGLVAVAGTVLLILDARAGRSEARSAWIAPTVGPQSAGLVGGLRF